jgi:hypothetical protein
MASVFERALLLGYLYLSVTLGSIGSFGPPMFFLPSIVAFVTLSLGLDAG